MTTQCCNYIKAYLRRRTAVGKGDGGEPDALVLDVLRLVGGVGGADEVRHAVVAQDPDVVLGINSIEFQQTVQRDFQQSV